MTNTQSNTPSEKAKPVTALASKLETGEFDETDADNDPSERGWIVYRERGEKPEDETEHRVPVQYWARYSRIHGL